MSHFTPSSVRLNVASILYYYISISNMTDVDNDNEKLVHNFYLIIAFRIQMEKVIKEG